MADPDNSIGDERSVVVDFDDNRLLTPLFGEHDRNLARIEQKLGVSMSSRGNRVAISGDAWSTEVAERALSDLYLRLQRGLDGSPVGERRAYALEQLGRAQIDVLVEAPPDGNQHVPQRDVVRHSRHADRAEIDRIELGQPVEPVFGHDPAGLLVGRAIPVEPGEIERNVETPRRRFDDADAFRHDLGADAVPGDDRDPVPAHSAPSSPSLSRSLGRTPLRRFWRDRSPLSRQPPAAARAASPSHLSDQSPSE